MPVQNKPVNTFLSMIFLLRDSLISDMNWLWISLSRFSRCNLCMDDNLLKGSKIVLSFPEESICGSIPNFCTSDSILKLSSLTPIEPTILEGLEKIFSPLAAI